MAEGRMLSKRVRRTKDIIPQHMRAAVIARDVNVCQYCGKKGIFKFRYGKPTVLEIIDQAVSASVDVNYFYNGRGVRPFHIDHIIPESRGGRTIIDNLILSCASCNLKKGVKVGNRQNAQA